MYSIKIETFLKEEREFFIHYYEGEEFSFQKRFFKNSDQLESFLNNFDNIYGSVTLLKPNEILQFPCKAISLIIFKNNCSDCKAILAFCENVYIMNYQGKTIDRITVN